MTKRTARQAQSKRGRRQAPCNIYVPANFNAEDVLPSELREYADCAHYFLHRIYWGRVQKKATRDEFVCLKWDYLRCVIPDRVLTPLKHALIDSGVIECDNQYIEGVKSFGYRLCPPYSNSTVIRITIKDEATAERVRANRRAEYKRIRLDVHRYLRKQLRRLEVDLPSAVSLLKPHPEYEIVKIPVENIAIGAFSFSVCRFGRVHTDLTRCSKVIRPALHVKGEHLVEIDVVNSQPLFLGILLLNYRAHGNKTIKTFTDRGNPYRQIDELIARTVAPVPSNKESTSPSTLRSNTTCTASSNASEHVAITQVATTNICPAELPVIRKHLTEDELLFVKLCEEGQLYEELMDRMEMPARRWAKEDFFEVLFGKNSFRSPMKDHFRELFPNVSEVIRVHKRQDYKFLPCLMQNIEANFIINTVCRRLMTELPAAPVFTIHDSILTTRHFAGEIEEIMRQEFQKLGLSPTLDRKDYGEERYKATEGL